MSAYYNDLKASQEQLLDELFQFLKQPSFAGTREGIPDMAGMVEKVMDEIGFKTERLELNGSCPFIYGEIGDGDTTILIYNHYDVQPADPESEWISPAFEPTLRDGKVFARGVADNKGNLVMRLQAIRYYMQQHGGKLPVKIKYLVEGEEEVGSPNLERLAEEYGHLWSDADICIWETGGVTDDGTPKTELGMKGVVFLELHVENGEHDLHSGNASLYESAVWRLINALNTMRDENGRVMIDGIRDFITPPTKEELELIANEEFDLDEALQTSGRKEFIRGSQDKEQILRNHYFEPTCNICGIWAGYTEPGGVKTIIPREATAKIDIRLVADIDCKQVIDMVRAHLEVRGYGDITIKELVSLPAGKSEAGNRVLQKSWEILEKSYGRKPHIIITSGASGPLYHVASQYKIPVFHTGVLYPGYKAHAPNENIRVEDYIKGFDAMLDVIDGFGGK